MVATSRIRQVGWALVLGACFAALLALTFKVNAVKSQVRLTERHIIAAERAKLMLETEFQTRASQHQLSDWNAVEFGYRAPRADQYLENERQLAMLGAPRGFGAPRQVRVALARADVAEEDVGVIGDWLDEGEGDGADEGDDTAAQARADNAAPRLAAGSLAQRLASPTTAMVAVAEVSE